MFIYFLLFTLQVYKLLNQEKIDIVFLFSYKFNKYLTSIQLCQVCVFIHIYYEQIISYYLIKGCVFKNFLIITLFNTNKNTPITTLVFIYLTCFDVLDDSQW